MNAHEKEYMISGPPRRTDGERCTRVLSSSIAPRLFRKASNPKPLLDPSALVRAALDSGKGGGSFNSGGGLGELSGAETG